MNEKKIAGSDAELTSVIKEQNAAKKKSIVIIAIGGVAAVISIPIAVVVGALGVLLTVIGVIAIIVGYKMMQKADNSVKQLLSDNILSPILNDIFDTWEHKPFERIPDATLHYTDLSLPDYDFASGSDYIKGVYRGVNVEMSDVRLVKEEIVTELVTDDEGNEVKEQRKEETVVFTGQYMICDFHKPLAADLLLTEGRARVLSLHSPVDQVETENVDFNQKFDIRSDDGHTAFYILTPHMMEYIMAMDEKAKGETRMRFSKEGTLYIAVDTGRDSFEEKKVKSEADLTRIRATYTADIRYFTDLIDELLKNETLFAK